LARVGKISEGEFIQLWNDSTKTVMEIMLTCGFRTRSTVYDKAAMLGLEKIDRKENKLRALRGNNIYDLFVDENSLLEEPNYEELIDLSVKQSEIFKKLVQTKLELDVYVDTNAPIILVFSADWHLGGEGVDYVSFNDDIQFIKMTPNLLVYLGGDATDNFVQPSKLGGVLAQEPIIRQRALCKAAIEEIKNKIACIGTGNHDWWTNQVAGVDITSELAKDLNILYTGLGGYLNLTVGDITYVIFRTHKMKFNSLSNPTHGVKQTWRTGIKDFDIGVGEHGHVSAIEPFKGHGREKIAIKTGTYKTWDSYAMGNGFWGVNINSPAVILYPNEFKMIPFADMRLAAELLNKEDEKC
jgi:hypothetical protein